MIRIKVTERDIKLGRQGSCARCPLALAISRKLKTNAQVTGRFAYRGRCDNFAAYALASEAVEFVEQFDAGVKVEPFSFSMSEIKDPDLLQQSLHVCSYQPYAGCED